MTSGNTIMVVGAACVVAAVPAQAETAYSQAWALGDGFAQLYAEFADDGAPQTLGIRFAEEMLDNLPAAPNTYSRCFDKDGDGKIAAKGECNGDYELIFMVSDDWAGASKLPFKWATVNWNPEGHPDPAPPPWGVPHFDFHFYVQDRASVGNIRAGKCAELIDCDDFKLAQKPVPAKYVHPDHIDVGAAVPAMGNHLINSKSPELAPGGPPFTHTFIYGAYDGHITFYEPMITREYLASQPEMCADVKLPEAWEVGGYYPTKYCIRYHDIENLYTVSLEGFVEREAN